jgi:hypothetical protein
MSRNNKVTESGATITWVDRETLRYSMPGYKALVWVDYEAGFFNSGRIVKSSSIVNWDVKPDNVDELINEDQKQEIIYEIQKYYRDQNKSCQVETV